MIKILRWIISILYSGLSLIASIVAIVHKSAPLWTCLLMILGAVFLLVFNFNYFCNKFILIIIPLLLIYISAVFNGFLGDGIIVLHLIIRFLVSILIFAMFYLSSSKRTKNKSIV